MKLILLNIVNQMKQSLILIICPDTDIFEHGFESPPVWWENRFLRT